MHPPGDENPIRLLEQLSMNAWPALHTVYDDGWVLRFAAGYTRRANAVHPLYAPSGDLDGHIGRCEGWYRARGLPAVFKLTPLSLPEELDVALARRSYQESPGASVRVMSLDELPAPDSAAVSLLPEASEAWLSAFCRMRGQDSRHVEAMRRMIAAIAPVKCCATLYRDGVPAALGLAVVERGYVGLFDITTDAALRRQGIGRGLVIYLLHWGRAHGASRAYLQVAPANLAALRLYDQIGFGEVYQYWYREKHG